MKKFVSAVTSLCMAATMVSVAAPAVSAADATKTLSIKAYAQSGSKYAADGNKVTISKDDIAAGDVTVPCAVYLTEATADTQTMSIPLTINSDQADVKNVTFNLIDPAKAYFDEEQTVTSAAGETLKTKNAIVFAAGLNKMKKYTPTGTSQLTVDDHQDAASAKNYYIGYGWTAPQGYSWTGAKSDDYPVFVFDVTFPKGTAAGDYKLQYCNYVKDAQGNPALMIETDERYANIGDLKNLVLNEMTITIGDAATTTTAATTAAVTTTAADTTAEATTTAAATTAPAADGDIVFDFGNYTAKAGEDVVVDVKLAKGNSHAVASMDVKFKLDKPLTIDAFDTSAPAFGGATVDANEDTYQASFISLDTKSEPVVGTDGEVVFELMVKVPDDAKDGTYKIGFDNCEIFKSGQNSDKWTYSVLNGEITVGEPTTGADTTTTTAADTTTAASTTAASTTAPDTTAPDTTAATTTTQSGTTATTPDGVLYGDANCDGKVNIADVVLVNRQLANTYELDAQGKKNADCCDAKGGDGLDSADSEAIIKHIIGLDGYVTLPVTTK